MRCWLLALLLAASSLARAQEGDPVVVTVGRQAIHESDVAARRATTTGDASRQELIDELVTEALVMPHAAEYGVVISDKEVDQALEAIQRANHLTRAQLEQLVRDRGITMVSYREVTRRRMTVLKTIDRAVGVITIPEAALRQRYGLGLVRSVQLRQAIIPLAADTPAARKLALTAGRRLLTTLRKHPRATPAGAKLFEGTFEAQNLLPEIAVALRSAQPGQVLGPFTVGKGDQVVLVVLALDRDPRTFDEVRPEVEHELREEELARRREAYLDGLRATTPVQP